MRRSLLEPAGGRARAGNESSRCPVGVVVLGEGSSGRRSPEMGEESKLKLAPSAQRPAPYLRGSAMRALQGAAAALPEFSRRFRAQSRVRCAEPTLSDSRRPPPGGAVSRAAAGLLFAAAILAVTGLAFAAPAKAQSTDPVWTATMTVGESTNANPADRWKGYSQAGSIGELTDRSITVGGSTAFVAAIWLQPNGTLLLRSTRSGPSLDTSYNLCISGTAFAWTPFKSGDTSADHANSGLSWTTGSKVELTLVGSSETCPTTDSEPTFGSETISNQTFVQQRAIDDLTLPAATGGDGTLTYTLTGPSGAALPAGLSFDATTRKLTGKPTASQSAMTYTYTATDADTSDPDSVSLTFTIAVTANSVPSFGGSTIANQTYVQHRAIDDLTLPEATGGDGDLTYGLERDHDTETSLPAGLEFDPSTRKLTGTPTESQSATTYRYSVGDGTEVGGGYDGAELTFTITITANAVPTFGANTIADQSYTQNAEISDLQLPSATGGDGTLTYELVGTLPTGLDYNSTSRKITGTPTATQAATTYTWRATDNNSDKVELTFDITVTAPANSAPSFDASSYGFTLAENADGSTAAVAVGTVSATDSDGDRVRYQITAGNNDNVFSLHLLNGTITYTGSGENYESFMDPDSAFVLTVRASDATANNEVTVTVGVTDVTEKPGKPAAPTVSATSGSNTSLDVTWAAPSNTGPTISSYDLRYRAGTSGDFTNGPQDETDTSASITGLTTGTSYQVQVRATSDEGDSDWSDSGSGTTSSQTVDTRPKWAPPDGYVFEYIYEPRVNAAFSLTLPPATGDGKLTYSLRPEKGATLPPGLEFDASTRTLSGMPSAAMELTGYRYTVTDGDGDTASIDFAIAVQHDALTGLAVKPVSGKANTELAVSWTAYSGAEKYRVKWKTASGTFNAGQESTTESYTITGLTADTEYTVQVTAIDTGPDPDTELARSEAKGTTTSSPDDAVPAFGAATISNQSYTQNTAIDTLTLPAATGGDGTLTYTLAGPSGEALPAGLGFNATTRQLTGTPTTVQAAKTYTYTATDGDATNPDAATLTFTITVVERVGVGDNAPTFGAATVSLQTYAKGVTIADLVLPAATGGDGTLTYTLTGPSGGALPAGLMFNATTRTLSGTPEASQAFATYTYTVTDGDATNPDTATLTFALGVLGVTVSPTAVTVAEADNPMTTGVEEHKATYTVVLDVDPGVETAVTVTPSVTVGSAVTVSPSSLTFTGGDAVSGGWNTAQTVTVEAVDDDFDNADNERTATISHTITNYSPVAAFSVEATVTDDDELSGLTVAAVAGETTKLAVSWNSYGGAEKYLVKWKTGGGAFNSGEESTTTSHTIDGLTAGTTYTVEVSAIDTGTGSDVVLGKAEKAGTTNNTPGGQRAHLRRGDHLEPELHAEHPDQHAHAAGGHRRRRDAHLRPRGAFRRGPAGGAGLQRDDAPAHRHADDGPGGEDLHLHRDRQRRHQPGRGHPDLHDHGCRARRGRGQRADLRRGDHPESGLRAEHSDQHAHAAGGHRRRRDAHLRPQRAGRRGPPAGAELRRGDAQADGHSDDGPDGEELRLHGNRQRRHRPGRGHPDLLDHGAGAPRDTGPDRHHQGRGLAGYGGVAGDLHGNADERGACGRTDGRPDGVGVRERRLRGSGRRGRRVGDVCRGEREQDLQRRHGRRCERRGRRPCDGDAGRRHGLQPRRGEERVGDGAGR